jgi:hypothetical protein
LSLLNLFLFFFFFFFRAFTLSTVMFLKWLQRKN